MSEKIQLIELHLLGDDSRQTRAALDSQTVSDYAARIHDGESFDPAIVYYDGKRHYRATGGHRLAAYRLAGRAVMLCVVRSGDRWDAIREGIADNLQHRGRPLSTADKKHNVLLVLRERSQLSDRAIAEMTGADHRTVGRRRQELEETGEISHFLPSTGRGNRTREIAPEKQQLDTQHCPCGGLWVSDGQEGRYCEDCHKIHPWNVFPVPELVPGHRIVAKAENGNVAVIDPHSTPGFYWLSILEGNGTKSPTVFGSMQARKLDRQKVTALLMQWGFVPAKQWCMQQAVGWPPYIPSVQERWKIERIRLDFYDRNGRFPHEPISVGRAPSHEPSDLQACSANAGAATTVAAMHGD